MENPKVFIPNNGKPKFSPDLKSVGKTTFTEIEKMEVLAEIDLMDTLENWHSVDNISGDTWKDLATIYSSIYDDKIAMSNLLLTFQGAVVSLEVARLKHVKAKGETEQSEEAYKRNQMMMRVHKEFSAIVERNQQIMIMIKNYVDTNEQIKKENKELKIELKKLTDAANF